MYYQKKVETEAGVYIETDLCSRSSERRFLPVRGRYLHNSYLMFLGLRGLSLVAYFLVSLVKSSLSLCIFLCKGRLGKRSKILSLTHKRSERELVQVFNENKGKNLSLLFDQCLVLLIPVVSYTPCYFLL